MREIKSDGNKLTACGSIRHSINEMLLFDNSPNDVAMTSLSLISEIFEQINSGKNFLQDLGRLKTRLLIV